MQYSVNMLKYLWFHFFFPSFAFSVNSSRLILCLSVNFSRSVPLPVFSFLTLSPLICQDSVSLFSLSLSLQKTNHCLITHRVTVNTGETESFKPQTDRFWGNSGVMKRKKRDQESTIEKKTEREKER